MPDPNVSNEDLIKHLGDQLLGELKSHFEKRDVDRAEALAKELDEKVQSAVEAAVTKKARPTVPGLTQDDKEVKAFSFAKLIEDHRMKVENSLEIEMCRVAAAAVQKDLATTTDAGGGYIVPTQVFESQIIPLLQEVVTAFSTGITNLGSNLNGIPVEIPKHTQATTAYWVSPEDEEVTPSDTAFGQIELRPHLVAARTRLSNRLIRLSNPAANTIVTKQIATDIGLAVDAAIYNGSGTSGQPTGIMQTDGILSETSFGDPAAAAAYDKLIEIEHALREAYTIRLGQPRWAFHPNILRQFKKQKDPTDNTQPKARRLIEGAAQPQASLAGYAFTDTTQLPTDSFLFGVFSEALYGQWQTMTIGIQDLAVLGKFQTQVLAGMECDVGVRHPEAFVKVTGVTGTT